MHSPSCNLDVAVPTSLFQLSPDPPMTFYLKEAKVPFGQKKQTIFYGQVLPFYRQKRGRYEGRIRWRHKLALQSHLKGSRSPPEKYIYHSTNSRPLEAGFHSPP